MCTDGMVLSRVACRSWVPERIFGSCQWLLLLHTARQKDLIDTEGEAGLCDEACHAAPDKTLSVAGCSAGTVAALWHNW